MRLVRFILKNTPGLPNIDMDLRTDNGTGVQERKVVFGRTGSGKSRAMDFLSGLYRIPMSLGHPEELKEMGYGAVWTDPDSVLYPAHLRPVDSGFVALVSGDKTHHVEPSKNDQVEETGAYWKGDDHRFRSGIPMRGRVNNLRSISGEMRTGSREPRGGLLIYPQNRDLGRPRMDGIKEEETKFEWIYRYKTKSSWTGSVESWLVWQNYLDMEDKAEKSEANEPPGRLQTLMELINKTLKETKIVGVTRGRVKAEKRADNETSPSNPITTCFNLENLSAGEQQAVLLLSDIRRRLRPGSLLVVDGPELHQDAYGQIRLLEAIEELRALRGAQLLVFTSSLETAEWFAPDEVYALSEKQTQPSELSSICPEH